GTWTADYFLLVDQVGNSQYLTATQLVASGFATLFVVTGLSDTTPPTLQSFEISPGAVDVTAGPALLNLTARLLDDASGVAGSGYSSSPSQVRFRSPSGNQFVDGLFSTNRISGTALDGTYEHAITIPQYAEAGTWTADYFLLVDQVGNSQYLTASQLAASGFATSFVVTGLSDTTPPTLQSFEISPGAVDVTAGPALLNLTARLLDDASGVAGSGYSSSPSQVRFRSPSGNQFVDGLFSTNRISGTALDGTYEHAITIPQYAEAGTWTVDYFLLVDQVGNSQYLTATQLVASGFATSFVVTGPSDGAPPTLQSFEISPGAVDTTGGPATVTLTARLSDDLSGVADGGGVDGQSFVAFQSPSGATSVSAYLYGGWNRISGTALDGTYSQTVTIAQHVESGTWSVTGFRVVDQVGNEQFLIATQLSALGLPTSFVVTGPSDTTAPTL